MFTDCPVCSRQFRIKAEQLTAANGLVKCGFCGEQFNALHRLHDKPLPVREPAVPVISDEEYLEDEPQFVIPEPAIEQAGGRSEDEPGPEPVKNDPSVEKVLLEAHNEQLPEQLLDREPKKYSIGSRIIWTALVLVLLITAAGQLIWFKRDSLYVLFPELKTYAELLCERWQCDVYRYRDLSAIKLINRDVRDHPRFEDVLLVNATMSNQGILVQPYPRIRLELFDTRGDLIAYRDFYPSDYLDNSIDIQNGMIPNATVHFVLEVTGSTAEAVSFEFNFL